LQEFTPIGYVECAQRYRYEAARQASIAPDNKAWIQLVDDDELRVGLRGLEDFERIWLVYELHLNERWHSLVQPPRADADKLGVFATRSPHRPNRIGLSCVRLLGVEGSRLHVGQHDLLDGTPVLDIKPYVPYADAFPEARAGWIDACEEVVYALRVTPAAREQIDWVHRCAGWDLMNFLQVQLRTDPTHAERKRIERRGDLYCIAFRTWRVEYAVVDDVQSVEVQRVYSGYRPEELAEDGEDRYADKDVHRAFVAEYGY
jgi:tRNA-Thr(GGU) m(6)t(6)A37 methyltransferase TsaA